MSKTYTKTNAIVTYVFICISLLCSIIFSLIVKFVPIEYGTVHTTYSSYIHEINRNYSIYALNSNTALIVALNFDVLLQLVMYICISIPLFSTKDEYSFGCVSCGVLGIIRMIAGLFPIIFFFNNGIQDKFVSGPGGAATFLIISYICGLVCFIVMCSKSNHNDLYSDGERRRKSVGSSLIDLIVNAGSDSDLFD